MEKDWQEVMHKNGIYRYDPKYGQLQEREHVPQSGIILQIMEIVELVCDNERQYEGGDGKQSDRRKEFNAFGIATIAMDRFHSRVVRAKPENVKNEQRATGHSTQVHRGRCLSHN